MFCSLKQTGDYIEPCRLVIIIPKISEIMLVEVIEYDKNIKIVFFIEIEDCQDKYAQNIILASD